MYNALALDTLDTLDLVPTTFRSERLQKLGIATLHSFDKQNEQNE